MEDVVSGMVRVATITVCSIRHGSHRYILFGVWPVIDNCMELKTIMIHRLDRCCEGQVEFRPTDTTLLLSIIYRCSG